MSQIVVPDNAVAGLAELHVPTSLADSSGRVLGTFIPYDAELYARNPSPLTSEERERRRKEGGGKTLDEFWAEMRPKYPDEFK